MKIAFKGALFAALLSLVGCGNVDFKMPDFKMPDLTLGFGGASETARLFFGQVKVQGPEGFCVDKSASKLRQGFAIMAPCAVISGDGEFPPHLGFVTYQVGRSGTATVVGSEEDLQQLLASDEGAMLLSDIGDVRILETDRDGSAVAVHYRVPREEQVAGLSSDVWRLFVDIKGRLATVSLRGYQDAPLTVDDGRSLVFLMRDLLVAANE